MLVAASGGAGLVIAISFGRSDNGAKVRTGPRKKRAQRLLSSFLLLLVLASAGEAFCGPCRIDKAVAIPLGRRSSYITVPARINGVDVTMGVDTGAQTFVTPETAARLHLPRAGGRAHIQGAVAAFTTNTVFIPDFEFADAHYRDKIAASIKLLNSNTFGKEPLAGLLGVDVLSHYDLDFDFSKSTLTLYSVRGCASMTPPWTGSYTTTPIGITAQRRISVPVRLNGAQLTAIFDTGATDSVLMRAAARKAGIDEAALRLERHASYVGAGNFTAQFPTHEFETLSAAGLNLNKIRLGVIGVPRTEADMLLGRDFMSSNRFWISYATGVMFVQRAQRPELSGVPAVWRDSPLIDRMAKKSELAALPPAPQPSLPRQSLPQASPQEKPAEPPCTLRTGGGERLSGRVIGFLSAEEAAAMIEFTQKKTHGTISPDYLGQRRVRVEDPRGALRTVLVPDHLTVHLGDVVEYTNGHRAPDLPCHYIPNLISRVIASAGR